MNALVLSLLFATTAPAATILSFDQVLTRAQKAPSVSVNVPNPDRMLQPATPAVITVQ